MTTVAYIEVEFDEASQHLVDVRCLIHELANLRRRLRISQAELAEQIGTTQSAISEWETFECSPNAASLARWARALDMRLVLEMTP